MLAKAAGKNNKAHHRALRLRESPPGVHNPWAMGPWGQGPMCPLGPLLLLCQSKTFRAVLFGVSGALLSLRGFKPYAHLAGFPRLSNKAHHRALPLRESPPWVHTPLGHGPMGTRAHVPSWPFGASLSIQCIAVLVLCLLNASQGNNMTGHLYYTIVLCLLCLLCFFSAGAGMQPRSNHKLTQCSSTSCFGLALSVAFFSAGAQPRHG